jgi:hypothetical protein
MNADIAIHFPIDFEVSGMKLRCTKCAPLIAQSARQWIDFTGWKNHLKSAIHTRGLKHEEEMLQRAVQINQATEAALAGEIEHSTNFAHLNTSLSTSVHAPPKQTRIVSANEQAMWESLDVDDIDFSAGTAPDTMADRRRIERELKDADMRDGTSLVDGFGDNYLILNDQDDEVLSEALRNAGSGL